MRIHKRKFRSTGKASVRVGLVGENFVELGYIPVSVYMFLNKIILLINARSADDIGLRRTSRYPSAAAALFHPLPLRTEGREILISY